MLVRSKQSSLALNRAVVPYTVNVVRVRTVRNHRVLVPPPAKLATLKIIVYRTVYQSELNSQMHEQKNAWMRALNIKW